MKRRRSKIAIWALAAWLLLVAATPATVNTWIVVKFFEPVPTLYLYENGEVVASFPVAVARPNVRLPLPATGKLVKIDLHAAWHPTPLSRQVYAEQHHGAYLPAEVAYGDPRNMMGSGKMILEFPAGYSPKPLRIHGTPERASIGKHVSGGCVRMYNEDLEKLAELLQNVKLPITVHFER